MAIKFEKIQPGMTLWDVHSELAGNTLMKRWGKWEVRVYSVHNGTTAQGRPLRYAMVSWNGNREERWYDDRLSRLYAKIPPKMQEKIDRSNRPWGM